MIRPEVGFVLMILEDVAADQPVGHPLYRVDRNNARVYQEPVGLDAQDAVRRQRVETSAANLVSAAWKNRDATPLGPQYDLKGDTVVNVRLEGDHYLEHGHIDPEGVDGVAFDELVNDCRSALLDERVYPDHPAFEDRKTHLRIMNERDDSSDYRDRFRAEFDVVFNFRERP